jgi:hypothetical protein
VRIAPKFERGLYVYWVGTALDNALFIFFPLLKTVSGNRGRSGWRRSNSAIPSIPENAFGGSLLNSQTKRRILCLAGCVSARGRRGV